MILYHGTINSLLPSILKHGLKPQPRRRWNIALKLTDNHTVYPAKFDAARVAAIFLTNDPQLAKNYADNRAIYYRAPVGEAFAWELLEVQKMMLGKDHATAIKLPGSPVVSDASPVVIKVTLTPHYEAILQEDEGQPGGNAVLCPCIIPPSFISIAKV